MMCGSIRYRRDTCAYFKKLMRVPGCLCFLTLIAILFILSGCATFPSNNFAVVPIDKFPEYANRDGSYVTPASVDYSIPDVNILALNDEIKTILDNSVAGIINPRQRLKALADIMSKKVKYNTQDDKFGTKTAIETFESGTGNCLSFVNLFISMARYVGLDSGYQDIKTPPNWVKNGEVLFVTRHIGAFVDFYTLGQTVYTVDLAGNKIVTVSDNKDSFLIAPSLDAEGPAVGSYTAISIPDRKAFAQYYNNVGSQFFADGNVENAYCYFVKAIKTYPELSFAWSNLGVVYSRNNQDDAAEKAYLQALSINKRKDETSAMTIMSNMARLYNKIGKKDQAALYEKEVKSFRDGNPYYHYSMGKRAYDDGRFEESVKDFKEAIRKQGNEPIFYYTLALSYIKLGDIENAEKNINKAKFYAPDNVVKNYYDQVLENLKDKVSNVQKPIS